MVGEWEIPTVVLEWVAMMEVSVVVLGVLETKEVDSVVKVLAGWGEEEEEDMGATLEIWDAGVEVDLVAV